MSENEQHPQNNPGWTPPNREGQSGWTNGRGPAEQGTGHTAGAPHTAGGDTPDPYARSAYGQVPLTPGTDPYLRSALHPNDGQPPNAQHPNAQHVGGTRPGLAGGPYLAATSPVRKERSRPGWAALVSVAAGAALVASFGTAGLTGAFSPDAPAASSSTTQSASSARSNADPVVTSTTTDPDWANVAAAVTPSVVAIDVRTANGAGAGSGVILDQAGHVLTNNHVVGDAVDGGIQVTLSDGRMFAAT
ncbi:MAG: S1C family serine protease, partial [Georgenia sp.]